MKYSNRNKENLIHIVENCEAVFQKRVDGIFVCVRSLIVYFFIVVGGFR